MSAEVHVQPVILFGACLEVETQLKAEITLVDPHFVVNGRRRTPPELSEATPYMPTRLPAKRRVVLIHFARNRADKCGGCNARNQARVTARRSAG